jgi:hypothetical protein
MKNTRTPFNHVRAKVQQADCGKQLTVALDPDPEILYPALEPMPLPRPSRPAISLTGTLTQKRVLERLSMSPC